MPAVEEAVTSRPTVRCPGVVTEPCARKRPFTMFALLCERAGLLTVTDPVLRTPRYVLENANTEARERGFMHEHVLGQVVLLRVENARVRHAELAEWFRELHLSKHYLPNATSPVNAFKKQATGSQTKMTYAAPWAGLDASGTVRWEDDSHDAERIVRRAVRSLRVSKKSGTPEVVAKVVFYKRSRRAAQTGVGGEKMRFTIDRERLHAQEAPIIEQWLRDAHSRYESGQAWVDTDALRGIARDYLTRRLRALMLRPGVYFVYRDLEGEMKRLQALVTRFGEECMFHPLALDDTKDNRTLLSRALADELEGEVTNLQRELNALRSKSQVQASRLAPLITRYEDVMALAHDYAEIGIHDGDALAQLTETIVTLRRMVDHHEKKRRST